MTITLASLASSSTKVAGRESNLVDNTTNKYPDYLIAGKVTTGTTPTASKTIEVHVVALMEDATWPDVFDGIDSAETVTTADIKNAVCKGVATMATDGTSNQTYYFGPVSVAARFGAMPKKFVVFVTHDTGAALNATGTNHAVHVTPVYYTST